MKEKVNSAGLGCLNFAYPPRKSVFTTGPSPSPES